MTSATPGALPPASSVATRRVLRGYGPLVVFAALFLLMATLVPSVDQTVTTAAAGATAPLGAGTVVTGGGTDLSGAVGAGTGGAAGTEGTAGTEGSPGEDVANGDDQVPDAQGSCPDRPMQIPGDPYSPPCVAFEGDNGGATSKGVTPDAIVVSARILDEKGFQQTLASLAGAEITDGPEDVRRTISGIADYLNSRFQLYGRQLQVEFFDGQGSATTELLGGGQAEAQADALTVSDRIGAFAELNGASGPFTDALARKQVIAFGTPYLSREWHEDRRPYNWSFATDCTIITETVAEIANNQLVGKDAAFAGEGLQGKPRKFATLAPENPEYQQCVDAGELIISAAGNPTPARIAYKLDIPSMSNQAANVVARLKSDGITTVVCGCDPIFPVFLTSRAAEQGYNPEWIITGSAGTDLDIVGQLYDKDQWSRALGVSYLGSFLPQRAGLGYAAYKAVRQDEPAFAVETIYAQMYMLALGIQLAGPNLTPETYEQGMFAYPGGTGPFGTWSFGPGKYTPTSDARIIWWNNDQVSPFNNKPGTYIESYGGQRFTPGRIPEEAQPKVFGR